LTPDRNNTGIQKGREGVEQMKTFFSLRRWEIRTARRAESHQLGLSEAEGLLQETLVEEENTDEVLSELAEDAINPAAAAA
jgi:hypothetical protein